MLLDAGADELRASAVTVSGPADRVAALGAEHEVLSSATLAGSGRAVVRLLGPLDDGDPAARELTGEPTPLQQLVVTLSRRRGSPSAVPPHPRSGVFEEVSR